MKSKTPIAAVEPFGFKSEGFEHDVYAQVAMRAELEEIRLLDFSYLMNPDIFLSPEFDPSNLANRLGSETANFIYDAERGIVAGGLIWYAEMKLKRKKALALRGNYFAVYSNLSDCDERYVESYFKKVAKFATFPYFRTLFSTQTSASGLALPPLPSLRERVD